MSHGIITLQNSFQSSTMNTADTKTEWDTYCVQELALLTPILIARGYVLDDIQKHTQGERYLMQAITTTSGKKLILTGVDSTGKKVVLKATRDDAGKKEIEHERLCRKFLQSIDFAGETFITPTETAYFNEHGFLVSVQEFIEQSCNFLERPVQEQFSITLRAFKGQESAHATTFNHRRTVKYIYGIRDGETYLQNFDQFIENINRLLPENEILETLIHAQALLNSHKIQIEQYCGFLTHTDFVPHNIRIHGEDIYLLDHSSLTFGNKYEGWARFINFMTLYNPPLQRALEKYVHDNRTPEESISLRMMRIYRLGEILWYYVRARSKSTGDLHILNERRIYFWKSVLDAVISEQEVPEEIIQKYRDARDSLRSEDERRRQQGLH